MSSSKANSSRKAGCPFPGGCVIWDPRSVLELLLPCPAAPTHRRRRWREGNNLLSQGKRLKLGQILHRREEENETQSSLQRGDTGAAGYLKLACTPPRRGHIKHLRDKLGPSHPPPAPQAAISWFLIAVLLPLSTYTLRSGITAVPPYLPLCPGNASTETASNIATYRFPHGQTASLFLQSPALPVCESTRLHNTDRSKRSPNQGAAVLTWQQ